jgi:hypothetical protein
MFDSESEKNDLIDLVENLNIISETDKVKCPGKKGHTMYVKACLVNCSKIANKLTRCRAISIFIDNLIKGLSQGTIGFDGERVKELSPTGKKKGPGGNSGQKEAPHEKVTISGKSSGKMEKSIIKKKQFKKVEKNTSKSSKKEISNKKNVLPKTYNHKWNKGKK